MVGDYLPRQNGKKQQEQVIILNTLLMGILVQQKQVIETIIKVQLRWVDLHQINLDFST